MCIPSARRGHGISLAGLQTVGNHQVDEEQQELLTTKPSLQLQKQRFLGRKILRHIVGPNNEILIKPI